jgi:hypothetical protein
MVAKSKADGRGRPRVHKEQRQSVNTWLSMALFERLKKHEEITGRTRLSIMVDALERYLDSDAAKLLESAAKKAEKL